MHRQRRAAKVLLDVCTAKVTGSTAVWWCDVQCGRAEWGWGEEAEEGEGGGVAAARKD